MSQAQRRLAAIMFTDMVGYSALAQRNEELSLDLLDEHRRLLRPLFAEFDGRVIGAAGDGFHVEFASARTSVMQDKRTSKNARDIGRELGVATILEGSVRKAGTTVRIFVQLIDAGSDEHLCSETYDRELTDIFAIQSDVAQQITEALNAQVSSDERARLDHRPTDESIHVAIDLFRRAIALDPRYAPAHVGLADSYIVLGNFGTYPPHSIYPEARAAAERALAIDPSLAEAYASPVWIAFLRLGLDDRPKVFEWLERACDEREGWLRVLGTSWFFDEVRDTPRFQAVLERIGLADVRPPVASNAAVSEVPHGDRSRDR
jgi:class 3 adenylate cyclase